ncbi:protein kinase domain-containing protein [Ditylenchus destructor]|uniref:Protein kinase domain-containing protein n=1 Tax=Ditylenchus destructor TaxID=166010 RepID=A0AAD4RCH0_9BILA|nr:protein kinase domain-containing protein [Ditylenchus destructor]
MAERETENDDSTSSTDTETSTPKVNTVVRSNLTGRRYSLESALSEGGFGTVFCASYLEEGQLRQAAAKIERWEGNMQATEVNVLQTARNLDCRRFPKLIDFGTKPRKYRFIIMTLLGQDLYKIRKDREGAIFTMSTSLRIALQTIDAICELHTRCKFICRDVKPSNFVIGLSKTNMERHIYIVDFGLCRRYIDRFGHLIPSRGQVGWRGTYRYGSLQCHLRMDLSRKDDLESWLYMVVECVTGRLPWSNERKRDIVHAQKIVARTLKRAEFLRNCPGVFGDILDLIDAMTFTSEPNYSDFIAKLRNACRERRISDDDPYDWEETNHRTTNDNETTAEFTARERTAIHN